MYCRKCGAKMSDTARFCDSCGEEVKKVRQRSDTQKYKERKIEAVSYTHLDVYKRQTYVYAISSAKQSIKSITDLFRYTPTI